MKILTAEQMNQVDRKTTEICGIPSLILMENAGFHLFNALNDWFEDLSNLSIAIICGKGNNGGDGMVLARQMIQRGIRPYIILLGKVTSVKGDAATNLDILIRSGQSIIEVTDEEAWQIVALNLANFDVIVDAILGTGMSKPLSGLYKAVVSEINQTDSFVLAVDIPSGMFSDSIDSVEDKVWADLTVTFTAPKIAQILNRDVEAVGDLIVAPIGTPDELLEIEEHRLNLITRKTASSLLLPRSADSHKGTFGHTALIAGSRGKAGAAGLTSMSALKSGSGLVTAIVPDCVQDLVASFRTEIMTEGLESTEEGTFSYFGIRNLLELLKNKDAAGIGPGMTTNDETVNFIRDAVRFSPVPLIIDADGINALAKVGDDIENENNQPLILTPHPGEFSRLTGVPTPELLSNQLEITSRFSQDNGVWVVLKTHRTLIASPNGQLFVSPTGNPGMATAGMGDVLTGVLTSLVGQAIAEGAVEEAEITGAICLAVYLHGLAGDIAAESTGQASLTAGDVISTLEDSYQALIEYQ